MSYHLLFNNNIIVVKHLSRTNFWIKKYMISALIFFLLLTFFEKHPDPFYFYKRNPNFILFNIILYISVI